MRNFISVLIPVLMTLLIIGCTDTGEHAALPESPEPASLPGTGDDVGKTIIYRDTWGIPHIYAPDVADGLYAQGWAQAADRPTQLLLNLKIAMGELTEISGDAGVSTSLVSHMFGHMRNANEAVAAMSDAERKRMTAFANGISDYYAKHPTQVPEFWQHAQVTPAMIDAFGRMFVYNWSIDEALGDLRRGGIEPEFVTTQRGSNQWAISPSRTASGHAILLIDPHLSWWGVSRFWEMRVHAGDWQGSGVGLAGSPYIGLGHNANMAWSMTTGGPDTADVFRLTLDKENPARYRYDDQWRELTPHTVALTFPDGSVKDYTWESSHHGPIIARQDGFAYAARIAYDSGTNRNQAWEALNFAQDYRSAVEACATLSFFPQNVMVADTSGNIYYQRTGRVPVRPENYDWSKPVDGSKSTSEWQGFHPSSDHLQVLNPDAGYMQNCNIPPDAMLPDSPFNLEAQPAYLFSSAAHGEQFDGWTNQRGARAIELLSRDADVTIDEALAYAVDITPFGYERWIEVLRQSEVPASDQLAEVLTWDGRLSKDSSAALKYYYWRKALHDSDGGTALREEIDDHYSTVTGRAPDAPAPSKAQQVLVRNAWTQAMATLEKHFSEHNPSWGDVFKVGRDGQSWPVEGGGGDHLGLTTLRSVGYDEPNERHERWGNRGQTSTQVVVLSKPIQSWIYLPVGQSDDPESAHYADQAASVFTNRKLRSSWWLPQDLQPHIVSREELQPRY